MARNFLVRNIRGTSWRICACGSHIQHWFNFGPSSQRTRCAALLCPNDATVGAHVHELTRQGGRDWHEYIVPVCHPCNMRSDDYWIENSVAIVPANTRVTGCELRYAAC
jgi:hypothetical protein